MNMFRYRVVFYCIVVMAAVQVSGSRYAHAEDKLLTNAVNFAGTITYLTTKVPGFMLLAVRNDEMAIAGFGKIADKSNKEPDGDTLFRIGSISKVFCGQTLGSMVLDRKVRFEDRLQDRLGYDVTLPELDSHPIRLIDLVTQASGLPREVPRPDGPPERSLRNEHERDPDRGPQGQPPAFPRRNGRLLFEFRLRPSWRHPGECRRQALR